MGILVRQNEEPLTRKKKPHLEHQSILHHSFLPLLCKLFEIKRLRLLRKCSYEAVDSFSLHWTLSIDFEFKTIWEEPKVMNEQTEKNSNCRDELRWNYIIDCDYKH